MDFRGIAWSVGGLVWGVAAIGFWTWTARYEFATDPAGEINSPHEWPLGTGLVLAEERPTLLLFIHPRCPCTRASVHEIERTLARADLPEWRQPNLIVVAAIPADAESAWRDTDTVRRASMLRRATTVWDVGGTETRHFGVSTSGTVRLYRPDAKLLFSGGITTSRGHEGDSAGGDRLHILLTDTSPEPMASTPVFGCRLYVERSPANIAVDAEGGSL